MKRLIGKPQPLFDTPPKDPLEEFFSFGAGAGDAGGGDSPPDDDDAAKKAAAAKAGDTTFNFPNEDWVPPQIRGKTAKEAAEIMKRQEGEFTKVNTAYAEATKLLERVKPSGGAPPPGGVPPAQSQNELTDLTVNMVLEMRVDKEITKHPEIAPYHDEIMQLLATVVDPRIRITNDAMSLVVNQIRGNHFEEINAATQKKVAAGTPPVPLEGTAVGGTPPRPVGLDLSKITKEKQENLAMWFEGDIQKAKENLLPAKE